MMNLPDPPIVYVVAPTLDMVRGWRNRHQLPTGAVAWLSRTVQVQQSPLLLAEVSYGEHAAAGFRDINEGVYWDLLYRAVHAWRTRDQVIDVERAPDVLTQIQEFWAARATAS